MDIATIPRHVRAAMRYFPLVGRPRPACPALTERVTAVAQAATAAHAGADMKEAANVLNMAALIASDCGLPDLATLWCWQHIDVYLRPGPLTTLHAGYLLEPVLNLVRLRIRADAGRPALALLHAMYQAITTSTNLAIGTRTLPLAVLTGSTAGRRDLVRWTWLQYLNEGIRIHALAGRWNEAAQHAKNLNGVGLHLLEGRQAATIGHLLHDGITTARSFLADSTLTEPWEHQVGSCLAVMCATPDTRPDAVHAMHDSYYAHHPVPGYEHYRARWALSAATLTGECHGREAQRLIDQVTAETLDAPDGYAAREILRHPNAQLSPPQREELGRIVASAGLGAMTVPDTLLSTLTTAVHLAERTLAATIN